MTRPILHGYWRSGPSWRVRIALNWKGAAYDQAPVNLLAGEQTSPAFLRLNPQGRLPALEVDGAVLTQSAAILEWLEETRPEPPLLPADALGRARVRAMSALVASDVTPLQNLGVGRELTAQLGASEAQVAAWRAHWIAAGLASLEAVAADAPGPFLHGGRPTLADLHLVPQLYAGRRFGVAVERFGRLLAAEAACAELPAFAAAHPDRQPDAPAAG